MGGYLQNLFQSLDNNAVLMQVEEDGHYEPVWCSQEFAEMMEGTVEECLRYEMAAENESVHQRGSETMDMLVQSILKRLVPLWQTILFF